LPAAPNSLSRLSALSASFCQFADLRAGFAGSLRKRKQINLPITAAVFEFAAGAVLITNDRGRCRKEVAVRALILPDRYLDVADLGRIFGASGGALFAAFLRLAGCIGL